MPLYSVCVATYQRPAGLTAMLDSVEAQELPSNSRVEVVVVDNDPPSAEAVVRAFAKSSGFDVTYLTQTGPNISETRNVGVAASSGEFLWFIDDDEVAEPRCLWHLIDTQERFSADVVFGRVLPMFGDETPEWIRLSSTFNRPVATTGQSAVTGGTSNTLVRRASLSRVDGPFDVDFGLTGGSDSMLFRTLARLDSKLVHARDSVATERIPAERATWRWMKDRRQRQGLNYGRQMILMSNGRGNAVVLRMLGIAGAQTAAFFLLSVLVWPSLRRRREFQQKGWSNYGKIQAFFGVTIVRTADTPQWVTDR